MAEDAPFLPGRGRRSFDKAPGGGNYGEKWHQRLDYLEFPKGQKPKEIRIVGGVFTVNQHFVQFRKKDGGRAGYYEVCPDFDWATGEFRQGTDSVCPICQDFSDSDLPDELRMFGSFRYFFDAFDITKIKAGGTDTAFGVVYTNKYGKNDIAKVSDTLDTYVDDLRGGCTLFWYYNPKSKDPKDRVSFTRGDQIPVKYNRKKDLYMIEIDGTRVIGSPTNFDEIVEMKDPDKIRADLRRLGLYDRLDEYLAATEGKGRRRSAASSTPDFGDDDDISSWEDEDNEEEEKPKRKKTTKKTAKKKSGKKAASKRKPKPEPEPEPDDEDGDDDWAEEDEDGVENPPEERDFDDGDDDGDDDWAEDEEDVDESSEEASEDAGEDDWSEDDDWAEDEEDTDDSSDDSSTDAAVDDDGDWEEEEEEEEEPPPPKKKPAKKKPAKKTAKKKPAKKKKPEPEPEDDDDFGEDDDDFGDDW